MQRVRIIRITAATRITHLVATAIMDMGHMRLHTVRPHTAPTRPHMGLTPSRIAPDASVRTIRQARRIFRTAVSGFRAHSAAGKGAARDAGDLGPRKPGGRVAMPPSLLAYASGATDWKCTTNVCARWPA